MKDFILHSHNKQAITTCIYILYRSFPYSSICHPFCIDTNRLVPCILGLPTSSETYAVCTDCKEVQPGTSMSFHYPRHHGYLDTTAFYNYDSYYEYYERISSYLFLCRPRRCSHANANGTTNRRSTDEDETVTRSSSNHALIHKSIHLSMYVLITLYVYMGSTVHTIHNHLYIFIETQRHPNGLDQTIYHSTVYIHTGLMILMIFMVNHPHW